MRSKKCSKSIENHSFLISLQRKTVEFHRKWSWIAHQMAMDWELLTSSFPQSTSWFHPYRMSHMDQFQLRIWILDQWDEGRQRISDGIVWRRSPVAHCTRRPEKEILHFFSKIQITQRKILKTEIFNPFSILGYCI